MLKLLAREIKQLVNLFVTIYCGRLVEMISSENMEDDRNNRHVCMMRCFIFESLGIMKSEINRSLL